MEVFRTIVAVGLKLKELFKVSFIYALPCCRAKEHSWCFVGFSSRSWLCINCGAYVLFKPQKGSFKGDYANFIDISRMGISAHYLSKEQEKELV